MKKINKSIVYSMNLLILILMLVMNGCSFKVDNKQEIQKEDSQNYNEALLMAVLYQQTAAEKDALCFQAFNWAKRVIQDDMKRMGLSKKQAVVVDIDETILNNSPYEAETILKNIYYPAKWKEWMEAAEGKPLAGAVDFLTYAADNGYDVYYITNRKEIYRKSTLENLKKFNFPQAEDAHLMMRTDGNSKDARRKKVEENHRIVLLMGDNLSDFATIFDQKSLEERQALVTQNKEQFGFHFIALPNAMYGAWLNALLNYKSDLSNVEKVKMLESHLQGF